MRIHVSSDVTPHYLGRGALTFNWRPLNEFIIMRPSSLGGGRILRRTLSVCPSVRPSRYRCHR